MPGPLPSGRGHSETVLTGVKFGVTALLVFLIPLVCAVIGALISKGDPARQFLWVIVGFSLGAVVSKVLAKRFVPSRKDR